jgi:beta-hydroxylase
MDIIKSYNKFIEDNIEDEDKKAFLNLDRIFPNHIHLKKNWKKIREEALDLIKKNKISSIEGDVFFEKEVTSDGKWNKYYIKWYNPIDKIVEEECPFTCNLINSLPEIQLAMFSILEPNAHIKSHEGPFKGCARYHLGLSTPNSEECFISVDNKKYHWKDGEDVLFDDTFTHFVHNNTDKTRIVLFCDIKRNFKNPLVNLINTSICEKAASLTTRKN